MSRKILEIFDEMNGHSEAEVWLKKHSIDMFIMGVKWAVENGITLEDLNKK